MERVDDERHPLTLRSLQQLSPQGRNFRLVAHDQGTLIQNFVALGPDFDLQRESSTHCRALRCGNSRAFLCGCGTQKSMRTAIRFVCTNCCFKESATSKDTNKEGQLSG